MSFEHWLDSGFGGNVFHGQLRKPDYSHLSPTRYGQRATYYHGPSNHCPYYALGLDFFPEMQTGRPSPWDRMLQGHAGRGLTVAFKWASETEFTSALKKVESRSLWGGLSSAAHEAFIMHRRHFPPEAYLNLTGAFFPLC